MNVDKHTLFLWQNSPSVIIGKHQNPWTECHLKAMEDDNVTLARRYSGGGTVFQDMGNSCFTFMSANSSYSSDKNMEILINALKNHFGVIAQKSGRNDMTVDGKKISGSAYKKSVDRSLHHGTMLLNVNMDALAKYLHPSKLKLQSKGIASVRSRVMNLADIVPIDHVSLCRAITSEFCKAYDEEMSNIDVVNSNDLRNEKSFMEHYEKLKNWDWRFGKTPEWDCHLNTRFDWGEIHLHIQSKQGIIQDVKIFSDHLMPLMIESLMQNLKGIQYTSSGIREACEKTKSETPVECHSQIDQFCDWFVQEM